MEPHKIFTAVAVIASSSASCRSSISSSGKTQNYSVSSGPGVGSPKENGRLSFICLDKTRRNLIFFLPCFSILG